MPTRIRPLHLTVLAVFAAGATLSAAPAKEETFDPNKPVSYYKQIRPIFQGQCNGCHQPAKAKGDYIMTEFQRLLKGGENSPAIVPGKAEESHLVKLITPDAKGKADMPQKADPLHDTQIALIKRWIAEGAKDDTPASARQEYDMEHPPVYARAPLVTSLDYSPDGKLIAVAGYHEVLLHQADGSGIVGRLVGLSERVQSVRFSPDGSKLVVAGGSPGRMGEIQVWDVAKRKLELSVSQTFDTLYGANWSPDGKLISFGGADNSLRVIEAATGKQAVFSGSANDWVLDTTWSVDGKHVIGASRDMTAKLTEVETQRFVDNITSITPGALKGGMHAVTRHPTKNEILVGGADGVPLSYRFFRETVRRIGDNANLIRKFPAMEGRIFAADYSPDGKTIVTASAYHGKGGVNFYSAEFDSTIPADLKKILEQVGSAKNPEVEKWVTSDVKLLKAVPFAKGGVYAVSYSPDGKTVATAGDEGVIRLIDPATGAVTKEFLSVPLADAATLASRAPDTHDAIARGTVEKALAKEALPAGAQVVSLDVAPRNIKLGKPTEYAQVLVTAKLADGTSADVTRMVQIAAQGLQADISARGLVRPKVDGKGALVLKLGAQQMEIPMEVSGMGTAFNPDYVRDVMPVLSKAGCNMGTCHGSKEGKNGFQLSLRGYDPVYDVTAFTEELWGRRANVAAPSHSLMLLKASGSVPHEGGQVTVPGELYYETIKAWIANGSTMNENSPRVTRIEVFPKNPVVEKIGSKQQMRVLATYADGVTKDVTAEAFIESGNTEVAEADKQGLITTLRRGEAPMLARFEGSYAATTVTVMGDRSGFAWVEPPKYNKIDELVSVKWQRMKILPSGVCSDTEFVRRVFLDLTGLPPSPEDVRAFLADQTDPKQKREALVDRLIASPAFVDQWSNKWADMLQVNSKFLGDQGAKLFREWIREQVANNTPYDKFVYSILTASGSTKDHPAANYYKILRTPEETMENTTHLFLATRFNCNKCHDHPFERWNQNQYYETAAFFSQVGLANDPQSGGQTIGGTAVEGAKPLYEIVSDTGKGEVIHLRTNKETPPVFPYPAKFAEKPQESRREKLAAWMTSADNQYFAMSYANRIWGYLTGTGVIEPLDDIRAGNPPSNPELLSYLTQEFVNSGFNVRHLMQMICKSRTYQLSVSGNQWNYDDKINYSHAKARRLTAEALYDSIYAVTGATSRIPGMQPGTRAAQLADSQTKLADGFLNNFGRPARESACECERSNDVQLGPVMALISGPTVGDAISDPNNAIAKLTAGIPDDRRLVEEIFLRVLGRSPNDGEVKAALETMAGMDAEHKALMAEWAVVELKNAPVIAKGEQERATKIAATQKELEAYKVKVAPENKKKTDARLAAIAKAEQVVKAAADAAPAQQVRWEPYVDVSTEWVPLDLEVTRADGVAKLEKQPDGSLLATALPPAEQKNGLYLVRAKTQLTGITAFKLELLPDDRLPNNGPGLAPDGNFVLAEFTVQQAAMDKKRPKRREGALTLMNPKADFSQKDFSPALVLKAGNRDKGWAVSPDTGFRHELTFELKEPAGVEGGTQFVFTLVQNFQNGRYVIGKFRLWATTSKVVRFGASQGVIAALNTAPEKRSKEQQALLAAEFQNQLRPYQETKKALALAKKPLPVDEMLVALESKVTDAQLPLVLDPKLLQLRRDAELSKAQIANRRLTAAQDLTWALINSPAFLFNY